MKFSYENHRKMADYLNDHKHKNNILQHTDLRGGSRLSREATLRSILTSAINTEEHLIHKPQVPKSVLFLTKILGVVQTEFLTPLADGFVGDDDAPFG